ncbi:sodium:calcium antiporter [Haloarchaeobius sp. HRN-SO-5]|uniref:sodium:calcium antiporter n=1 Tax=Haloarchaeobius sp. HRN-SO-5 TaxID=3446118 RepID=UPI003EB8F350
MVGPSVPLTLLVGAAGLAVLVKSAQTAVGAVTRLAVHYDVPDIVVGVTVVAIGTSLPEIAAHVIASVGIVSSALDYEVTSATVLGGNMGSSITQQLLLFGIFLVGYGRYRPRTAFLRTTYVPMVLASALVLVFAWDRVLSQVEGVVLVAVYLAYTYWAIENRERVGAIPEGESKRVGRDAALSVLGLVGVLVSAYVVLEAVELVVAVLGLGGSIVGVVTIGLAAALPELSTVLRGIRRRSPDIAVGTLVGSNVVNPLLAIGLGGSISSYAVPAVVVLWDLPVKLVAGVGVLAWLRYGSDGTLRRRDGFYFVVAYFVFLSGRLLLFPTQ